MEDWDNVYGFDYSCIKEVALREPLVDTVDLKAVVTKPFAFKRIDLSTAKKEDLAFEAPFKLKATRNDFIHAFIGWFDTEFSCLHVPLSFSTGPHARYTHWKQTVFYTRDTIAVSENEEIEGSIKVSPNARNNRDLDIVIKYQHNGSSGSTSETLEFQMCVSQL
ncbi:hypothetical protein M407DRAFT_30782 [Tulasnella calospora MUT 4182]|uniref:Protein arginine N-methyltransferase domain-containing protein n=1 Tax=Tulasnella calospora MUT 4182 TaxID=1051891 RepID=A0A0C3LDK9_9AGAM|nr:hypothetical protein M407DRAFT_30782 [Tulasnella calospora MUT 4182]